MFKLPSFFSFFAHASTVGIVDGGKDEQPVAGSQCPPVNYEMVADPVQYCVAVINTQMLLAFHLSGML